MKDKFTLNWGWRGIKLSMGTKTIIAFLIILILPMLGVYFFLTGYITSFFTDNYTKKLETEIKQINHIFINELSYMTKFSEFITKNDSFKEDISLGKNKQIQNYLLNLSNEMHGINSVFVISRENNLSITSEGTTYDIERGFREPLKKVFEEGRSVKGFDILNQNQMFSITNIRDSDYNVADGSFFVFYEFVPFIVNGEEYALGEVTLLNGYNYLMNKIYNISGYSAAVFHISGVSEEIIVSNSSSADLWFAGLDLPNSFIKQFHEQPMLSGVFNINKSKTAVAAIPLRNFNGEVIGGLSIATGLSQINKVTGNFKGEIVKITVFFALFVIIIGALVYHDTKRPVKALEEAMGEVSRNNFDVRLNFRTFDEFEDISEYFNIMVKNIQSNTEKLNQYNSLSTLISSTLDEEEVLSLSLDRIMEFSASQMGVIYFYDKDTETLTPYIGRNVEFDQLKKIALEGGIVEQVAKSNTYFCINEINPENIFLDAGFLTIVPSEISAFPINIQKDGLLGVMVLASVHNHQKEELDIINNLLVQVAIVLDNCLTHSKVSELSVKDELTKLYNRRYLLRELGSEIERYKRYKTPLSVGIFDIDDFKRINDTYGHSTGDDVLVSLSKLVYQYKRETDIFGRFGGEEFLMILPNTNREDLEIALDRLRSVINEELIKKVGFRVTVSAGGASCESLEDVTIDNLLDAADIKLYKAKSTGKNKVLV